VYIRLYIFQSCATYRCLLTFNTCVCVWL